MKLQQSQKACDVCLPSVQRKHPIHIEMPANVCYLWAGSA